MVPGDIDCDVERGGPRVPIRPIAVEPVSRLGMRISYSLEQLIALPNNDFSLSPFLGLAINLPGARNGAYLPGLSDATL